jgi:hypothetical protein
MNDYITLLQREREKIGQWKEITEDKFYEMLEVLPPLKWRDGGFFLSELWCGDIGYFYQELDGKFYETMWSVNAKRKTILESLKSHIAGQAA